MWASPFCSVSAVRGLCLFLEPWQFSHHSLSLFLSSAPLSCFSLSISLPLSFLSLHLSSAFILSGYTWQSCLWSVKDQRTKVAASNDSSPKKKYTSCTVIPMYDILYSVENKERYLEFVSFSYTETWWGSKQHGTTLTVIVWKKKRKKSIF